MSREKYHLLCNFGNGLQIIEGAIEDYEEALYLQNEYRIAYNKPIDLVNDEGLKELRDDLENKSSLLSDE